MKLSCVFAQRTTLQTRAIRDNRFFYRKKA
jgi:hypothetical protein